MALLLAPIVNAHCSRTAPMHAGDRTAYVSYRGRIWRDMDPDRCGFLPNLLAGQLSFERWVQHALDVPLLLLTDGEMLRPAPGVTFRAFLKHGIDGRFPTRHDWDVHLSTLFTEARLKRFLEVRGADAAPTAARGTAVPAVWKGLLYDAHALSAATQFARGIKPEELRDLSESAARFGLRGTYRGEALSDLCREVVAIAGAGLKRQGEDASYLDPHREVVASRHSPADRWPRNEIVPEVLAACEYRPA